jgi:hypothetical protein
MLSQRSLEVATAALAGTFGAAIAISSLDNGVGWTSAGVGAGTFPFITGLLIVGGSLYNLVHGALHAGPPVLGRRQAARLGSLFLPALAFVAAIPILGLHVAAAAYMFGTLAIPRRRPLARAALIALATAAALYAVFDWMFQVTLPRGLLGAALGY